jgi:hypothetical protein
MKVLEDLFLERDSAGNLKIKDGIDHKVLKDLTISLRNLQSIQFAAKGIVETTLRLLDNRPTIDDLTDDEESDLSGISQDFEELKTTK